jgi:hypothetical protein
MHTTYIPAAHNHSEMAHASKTSHPNGASWAQPTVKVVLGFYSIFDGGKVRTSSHPYLCICVLIQLIHKNSSHTV